MSAHRKMAAKGFTLVEILIVVVILGILAAIVIPQFTRASESAQAASVASQLQTIRSQVELYQVQHGGTAAALGTGDKGWDNMLTEEDGFGPYFQQAPRNPLAPDRNLSDTVVTTGFAGGWLAEGGRIKAIVRGGEPNVITALEGAGLVNDDDDEDTHGDFVVATGD